jgi:hypothetical protein
MSYEWYDRADTVVYKKSSIIITTLLARMKHLDNLII